MDIDHLRQASLAGGAVEFWVLNPVQHTVLIYDRGVRLYGDGDVIPLDAFVAGAGIDVRSFF